MSLIRYNDIITSTKDLEKAVSMRIEYKLNKYNKYITSQEENNKWETLLIIWRVVKLLYFNFQLNKLNKVILLFLM